MCVCAKDHIIADNRFDVQVNQDQIEAIAHEIVELQGLLSVVLVRKVDLENYAIG